ncbi:hypothetical protein KM908_14355 [Alkalihalobacillus clausii]|uniref:sigma factor n=1 Tax=Shouchella clausii TaxID=79880 RepID=UPI001C2410BD|nr:sigma factor [Shouchella clausii]MBU8597324.1 hypothetical protein [Shouchella clausii]
MFHENLIEENMYLVHVVVADFSRNRSYLKADLESDLMLELWKAIQQYDDSHGAKLSTYITRRLRRKALSVIDPKNNANASYYSRKAAPTASDGEPLEVEDIIDAATPYVDTKTTKADQRQLIDFLLDRTKVDEVTIAVVTNFPKYRTPNALAKALGLDFNQVDRRLRKLARNFDADLFGDYRDYLYAV